jgi:RNA polymerase sigma-70 factor (ECF subfamily)
MLYPVGMNGGYLEEGEAAVQERSDEELLAASVESPALFAFLVRRYEEPFLRKAQAIVRSREEAQDVVQEAFTKIYLNAGRFKKQEGASFSSWGYRILINTALTRYTRAKRRGERVAELDEEIWALIPDRNLRQFEKKELTDLVASVFSRMSPLFARALSLFFIEGKTQEEIAELEGVSVGAIKTRVHRAKQEFRKVCEAISTAV